ncbi:glycosyl hydrolase [Paraburkholderia sp. IMGN_8]|uniref:glycosyl hydrolase n=1 Tax=Paraburkholderia sp. IMGN_8 TaxID=3136564 RepID=UPI0031015A32
MNVGVQVKIEHFGPDDAARIRRTGFKFVRFGVWTDRLPDAAYQKRVAEAFSVARIAGLPVLLTVRSTTPVISAQTAPAARSKALAQAGTAFGRTVAALRHSYASQLLAIEIWNEPDLPKYWPTGDALATFSPYIRAACSQLQGTTARVPTFGFGFSRAPLSGSLPDALLQQVVSTAPGCIGAVSYHAYGMSADAIHNTMRSTRARYAMPAVVTEWGVPSIATTDGNEGQASRVRAFLNTLRSTGTPLVSIYEWKDTSSGSNNRERNFGLLTSEGEDKPSLGATSKALRSFEVSGPASGASR